MIGISMLDSPYKDLVGFWKMLESMGFRAVGTNDPFTEKDLDVNLFRSGKHYFWIGIEKNPIKISFSGAYTHNAELFTLPKDFDRVVDWLYDYIRHYKEDFLNTQSEFFSETNNEEGLSNIKNGGMPDEDL